MDDPGAEKTTGLGHVSLRVRNLDCENEAATIERGLGRCDGVEAIRVLPRSGRVEISYRENQTNPEALSRHLEDLGFPIEAGRVPVSPPAPWRNPKVLTSLGSGALLLAGWLLSLMGAPRAVSSACFLVALPVGGWFFGREALEDLLFQRRVGIELLMSVAAVVALLLGEGAEAATLVFLYSISEAAEGYTEDKTRGAVKALMALVPKVALLRRNGEEREVPAEELRVGDLFIVRPGESLATDGVVEHGASSVNQAPVTGESLPVEKGIGDEVFAGSINISGGLDVRVTHTFTENTLSRIIKLVEEAQERKGRRQEIIERFGRRYSPAVLLAGILVALVPPLALSAPWMDWITRATVFVVAAAPCALAMSVPITFVAALGTAARQGVLVKGGVHLEDLATCGVVAFDKTGTLTNGEFQVTGTSPFTSDSSDHLLGLAAAVESRSEHPIAQTLVKAAWARGLKVQRAREFHSHPGAGASAEVMGTKIIVGSPSTPGMPELPQDAEEQFSQLQKDGNTVILVGDEVAVLGLIALRDTLRPAAVEVVKALHLEGMQVYMLTGDNREVADSIGHEADVDVVLSGLKPEEKALRVRELELTLGPTVMVGDGVNDAPALASATVGVAMGAAGTDAALETADVVLMADDLTNLVYAIRHSRRTRGIVVQNLVLSVLVIGSLVVGAILGAFSLSVAVVAHETSEFLVIANGLRMLKEPKRG